LSVHSVTKRRLRIVDKEISIGKTVHHRMLNRFWSGFWHLACVTRLPDIATLTAVGWKSKPLEKLLTAAPMSASENATKIDADRLSAEFSFAFVANDHRVLEQ
jgi:hypothetical protein